MIAPGLMSNPTANIVLVEPEIPNNTGNIGRTCVSLQSNLMLVGPLGFKITDKQVKRSGLDYWPHLNWQMYEDYDSWKVQTSAIGGKRYYLTTKTDRTIYDVQFEKGDSLIFGPESRGLNGRIREDNEESLVTIPMLGPTRSLNLANSVSICLFELFRQTR